MISRRSVSKPGVSTGAHNRGRFSLAVAVLFRTAALCGVLACAVLAASVADAREKVDVIILQNGDRVTGEIKQLDLGILTVSTDHVGTVSVEWVAVVSVESTQLFEVILSDGDQFVGTFSPEPVSGELAIVGPESERTILQCARMVKINQLGRTRWKRWRGSFSLGASLTTANNQRSLSLDAEATYQGERFRVQNTITGSMSDQDDAARTSWGTVVANYQWYLSNRWFLYSQLQFDRNEQLDLDLRTTISGGGGRYLVATGRSQLYCSVGISALREVYTTEESADWSSELALATDYELFLFQGRDTSITSSLSLLPSLSVSGRYRIEYSASFNRKLIRDFTISFNLNGSYDSTPPENSQSSDTSFTINLGWSF